MCAFHRPGRDQKLGTQVLLVSTCTLNTFKMEWLEVKCEALGSFFFFLNIHFFGHHFPKLYLNSNHQHLLSWQHAIWERFAVSLDMSLKFHNTSSYIYRALWIQNCQCMFSEMQTGKWVREDVKLPGVTEAQYYIKMCEPFLKLLQFHDWDYRSLSQSQVLLNIGFFVTAQVTHS